MADVDKYRKGFEEQLKQENDRRDESVAESFVKGIFRVPADEAKSYVRDADEQRGRDDARRGDDFNPSEKKDDSSGCFLTSACVTFAGLPDNCHELVTLRLLRDEYVAHLPGGKALIDEYYEQAPGLVAAIHLSTDRDDLLTALLVDIRQIVAAVDAGRPQVALEQYRRLFRNLQEERST